MPTYANRQEFANKADWEGGVVEFVLGYGVRLDDLPGDDTELREAVAAVLAAKPAIDRLESLLPEPGEGDDD